MQLVPLPQTNLYLKKKLDQNNSEPNKNEAVKEGENQKIHTKEKTDR